MKDDGVFMDKDGKWGYRISILINGKKKDIRRKKDEVGKPFADRYSAIIGRYKALEQIKNPSIQRPIVPTTVKEVFLDYRENGSYSKAYRTLQKQDSLWKNHISKRFGSLYVHQLTSSSINDYLSELYYKNGYSYRYVEGFLKVFWIIIGRAYTNNHIDLTTYNHLCVNKESKITMPKIKTNEDMGIFAFDRDQLILLDEYFKGTNAETAYLLGKYCGLRINETFGLKWSNVNFENKTIIIDRQQQYQDGLIKLVSVKTRSGNRTIYLCDKMYSHLKKKYEQKQKDEIAFRSVRRQKARRIEDIDGKQILSTELVNCLSDGTIQTPNSFKYPSREIKKSLHIPFKYHYLRHTYGTMMAEMNTPLHLLCNQMGHSNSRTTQKYYIGLTKTGIDIVKHNINQI